MPSGRADDEEYVARKQALVKAGDCGMFDEVDFLVPVAYPRFGPTDGAAWNTYEPYTRLAIEGSRELRRSDGSSLPVVPFLTVSIANGNSNHHKEILLDLQTPDPLDPRWACSWTSCSPCRCAPRFSGSARTPT
jgi:hypothetical protein